MKKSIWFIMLFLLLTVNINTIYADSQYLGTKSIYIDTNKTVGADHYGYSDGTRAFDVDSAGNVTFQQDIIIESNKWKLRVDPNSDNLIYYFYDTNTAQWTVHSTLSKP